MQSQMPTYFEMIRAPFLTSIFAPLIAGTLLAVIASGSFNLLGLILVFIMGTALHSATNVYNDIYDTIQGTDKVLDYLGRYVHRVAITNNRILSIDDGNVTFRYKDSRDARWKQMTLPADEFPALIRTAIRSSPRMRS